MLMQMAAPRDDLVPDGLGVGLKRGERERGIGGGRSHGSVPMRVGISEDIARFISWHTVARHERPSECESQPAVTPRVFPRPAT